MRLRSWLLLTATALSSACISGRVLEGYPGYPFMRLDMPASPDTAFVDAQRALREEGFEVDFSSRERGLIQTRPLELERLGLLLSVVVGEAPDARAGASLWLAGYDTRAGGARRINPLDEHGWRELQRIASALAGRLGSPPPVGPEASGHPRPASEAGDG